MQDVILCTTGCEVQDVNRRGDHCDHWSSLVFGDNDGRPHGEASCGFRDR